MIATGFESGVEWHRRAPMQIEKEARKSLEAFPRRPMRGLITVERDLLRQPTLSLERPPKERFGRRDIPLGPQQEVDRRAGRIDRTA